MKTGNDGNRRLENGRLANYQDASTPQHWDEWWESYPNPKFYEPYRSGYVNYFGSPFKRYLPKNGLILEAGCTTGRS